MSDKNYEGAKGCNLGKMKAYAVGHDDHVEIYDDEKNYLLQEFKIPVEGA